MNSKILLDIANARTQTNSERFKEIEKERDIQFKESSSNLNLLLSQLQIEEEKPKPAVLPTVHETPSSLSHDKRETFAPPSHDLKVTSSQELKEEIKLFSTTAPSLSNPPLPKANTEDTKLINSPPSKSSLELKQKQEDSKTGSKEYENRKEKLIKMESMIESLLNDKTAFPPVKRVYYPKVNLKVQQISRDRAQIIRVVTLFIED